MVRELTADEVDFSIELRPEHTQVEGNCSAIDEETDEQTKTWIYEQLEGGNDWAWCCVRVVARWEGFEGDDFLGCCSYLSEGDFKVGGYYEDMKQQALDDLNRTISEVSGKLEALEEAE
jgi:hypothetical protein